MAGVGKAAAGTTGSLNPVTLQYDADTGHPNVAASASGGTLATEGPHVSGSPQQERSNTVVGGFGGVTVGVLISNAGNAQGLKQPSETISGDIGWGFGGSFQVSISHGSIVTVQIGIGFGYGLAYSDINTATAAKGTNW